MKDDPDAPWRLVVELGGDVCVLGYADAKLLHAALGMMLADGSRLSDHPEDAFSYATRGHPLDDGDTFSNVPSDPTMGVEERLRELYASLLRREPTRIQPMPPDFLTEGHEAGEESALARRPARTAGSSSSLSTDSDGSPKGDPSRRDMGKA